MPLYESLLRVRYTAEDRADAAEAVESILSQVQEHIDVCDAYAETEPREVEREGVDDAN